MRLRAPSRAAPAAMLLLALAGMPAAAQPLPATGPNASAVPQHEARPAASARAAAAVQVPTSRLDPHVRPRRITLEIEPLGDRIGAQTTRFRGDATLEFIVTRPTRTIELHASELRIETSRLDGRPLPAPVASADGQRLRWTLPRAIEVGDHRLDVVYEGSIGQGAEGLYRIDSPSPQGMQHVLATQMEPTGARRLLPLWDEPAYRVSYELAIVLPTGVRAVSNAAVYERQLLSPASEGGPDRERWMFHATPPMPSYLLAVFAGPFEALESDRRAPRLRMLTLPGRSAEAALGLEATARTLEAYQDYFAQPYPLPKLDSVALPGGFDGAMENWGAIAYSEARLLYDPERSPAPQRTEARVIVAHEVAHQWFGNLVTMSWWDELWLNEGFASWMANRTVQQLYPEESIWADAARGVDRAMQDDSLPGAGAVRRPVRDDRAAFGSFDAITYDKGMAFVRMLEQWLGPEVFRDGLRRYMATHAYGHARTDELWRQLESASGRAVAPWASAWIDRAGLPRVDLSSRCAEGRLEVRLTQTPFRTLGLAPARSARTERSRADTRPGTATAPLLWPVPLAISRLGDDGRARETRRLVLDGPEAVESFEGCDGSLKLNAEGTGYYRSRHAPADAARLDALYPRLGETDRLNLLQDRWALALAGDAPLDGWLALVDQFGGEDSPVAWDHLARAVVRLEAVQGRGGDAVAWRARLAGIAASRLAALGLEPRAGDTARQRETRDDLIGLLGRLDHAPTLEAVRALWQRQVPDAAASIDGLPASIRGGVLRSIGRHADRARLAQLRRLVASEADAGRREQLWAAIGQVRDPALAAALLGQVATDQVPVDAVGGLMANLARSGHRSLVWRTLDRRFEALSRQLSDWGAALLAPMVLAGSADAADAARVLDWTRRHVGATALGPARNAAETIEVNAALRTRLLPALERWGGGG